MQNLITIKFYTKPYSIFFSQRNATYCLNKPRTFITFLYLLILMQVGVSCLILHVSFNHMTELFLQNFVLISCKDIIICLSCSTNVYVLYLNKEFVHQVRKKTIIIQGYCTGLLYRAIIQGYYKGLLYRIIIQGYYTGLL